MWHWLLLKSSPSLYNGRWLELRRLELGPEAEVVAAAEVGHPEAVEEPLHQA